MDFRPANESPEDIRREAETIKAYNRVRGCRAVKLSPTLYQADFALFEEASRQLWGWAEVKVYTDEIRAYVPLGVAKWRALLSLAALTEHPAHLVVRTPSRLYEHRLERRGYEIRIDGRTDRKQPGDLEPCILIRPEALTELRADLPPL